MRVYFGSQGVTVGQVWQRKREALGTTHLESTEVTTSAQLPPYFSRVLAHINGMRGEMGTKIKLIDISFFARTIKIYFLRKLRAQDTVS